MDDFPIESLVIDSYRGCSIAMFDGWRVEWFRLRRVHVTRVAWLDMVS